MKQLIRRAMPLVFGFGLVLTTVLLLMPSYAVPKSFNFYDKAQHCLVFITLALVGFSAYPKNIKTIVFGLIFYGGAMEVCQSVLTTTRHGDLVDWFADSVGIVMGLGVYVASQKLIEITTNKIAT
jgi:VanZ family protein